MIAARARKIADFQHGVEPELNSRGLYTIASNGDTPYIPNAQTGKSKQVAEILDEGPFALITNDLADVNQRLMSPYFGDLAEWLCIAFWQSSRMASSYTSAARSAAYRRVRTGNTHHERTYSVFPEIRCAITHLSLTT